MNKATITTIAFFNGFVANKVMATSRDLLWWFCYKGNDNKLSPFFFFFSSSLILLLQRRIIH
jgi:hypothetical protein